jgi:EAL domain-containing protein (putative c-di-GMP-specific phosphodiesterase class I)
MTWLRNRLPSSWRSVAKSVETAEHARWARLAGMTMAQGLYFGPPVPADLFDTWLANATRTTLSGLAT